MRKVMVGKAVRFVLASGHRVAGSCAGSDAEVIPKMAVTAMRATTDAADTAPHIVAMNPPGWETLAAQRAVHTTAPTATNSPQGRYLSELALRRFARRRSHDVVVPVWLHRVTGGLSAQPVRCCTERRGSYVH